RHLHSFPPRRSSDLVAGRPGDGPAAARTGTDGRHYAPAREPSAPARAPAVGPGLGTSGPEPGRGVARPWLAGARPGHRRGCRRLAAAGGRCASRARALTAMDPARLPLRDVHLPPAPGWWPPAPGWWWLAAVVVLIVLLVAGWRLWLARRRRRWTGWFLAQAGSGSPAARLEAMSALLRRAARRAQPGAERLQGEAWLEFLDGGQGLEFRTGPGRLLLDGGFRRQVDATAVDAVATLAHARFLALMAQRPRIRR